MASTSNYFGSGLTQVDNTELPSCGIFTLCILYIICRSSETGGGHFRFTGNHAPRLFTLMESMLPRRKLNDYSTC